MIKIVLKNENGRNLISIFDTNENPNDKKHLFERHNLFKIKGIASRVNLLTNSLEVYRTDPEIILEILDVLPDEKVSITKDLYNQIPEEVYKLIEMKESEELSFKETKDLRSTILFPKSFIRTADLMASSRYLNILLKVFNNELNTIVLDSGTITKITNISDKTQIDAEVKNIIVLNPELLLVRKKLCKRVLKSGAKLIFIWNKPPSTKLEESLLLKDSLFYSL